MPVISQTINIMFAKILTNIFLQFAFEKQCVEGSNKIKLDLSETNTGVYMLKIVNEDGYSVLKVIKE